LQLTYDLEKSHDENILYIKISISLLNYVIKQFGQINHQFNLILGVMLGWDVILAIE